jgi:hypothetical protein
LDYRRGLQKHHLGKINGPSIETLLAILEVLPFNKKAMAMAARERGADL